MALLKCLMVEELLFEAVRGSVEFLAAVVLPKCLVVEELFFEALRGSVELPAAALAVVLPKCSAVFTEARRLTNGDRGGRGLSCMCIRKRS